MKSKVVTGIMLTLLLIYMLVLTLGIQPLRAQPRTWRYIYVSNLECVSSIAVDNNLVWFGTYGQGVFRYNKTDDSWSVYNTNNSGLIGNCVASVAVDGNFVWFGTQHWSGSVGPGNGVSRYDKTNGTWTTFDLYNSEIAGTNVQSIAVNGDFIWFGISGGGISRYNKSDDTWTTYSSGLVNLLVISLAIDRDELWAGTNGQYTTNDGLTRFNLTSGKWITYTGNGLDMVTEIVVDGDLVWFARFEGDGGGTKYNKTSDTWTFYNFFRDVESVAIDDNSTWFGTRTGVFEYHKKNNTWTTFNSGNSGLLTNWVNAITVDGRYVWFSCYSGGVARYDKSTNEWMCWSSITPPCITILSPQNITYKTDSVPLTLTVNETTSWIGYSLDNQANVTITENTTLTGLASGQHNIIVYANDTSGEMGYSNIVYFKVSILPSLPVGGKVIPIDKLMIEPELQTPWIWLTTIILPLVLTVVYVKKRKRNIEINS